MAQRLYGDWQLLNFKPSSHVEWAKNEYLLWPAWAYRVVAPKTRERELNILQRAVLGLFRAGMTDILAIADKLAIHRDLVYFIAREINEKRLIDMQGQVTDEGVRVLDESIEEAYDMVAGYVFQDPWDGTLWPRFVERLQYCDYDLNQEGYPVLNLGTLGKPHIQRAFMVEPRDIPSPSVPTKVGVIEAVAAHRRRLRNLESSSEEEDRNSLLGIAPVGFINRVSFIEELPELVFLVSYVYLPRDSGGHYGWYACDPFGLGYSDKFRQRIEKNATANPPLYNFIDSLLKKSVKDGLEGHKQWIETMRMRAKSEVEKKLTINIRESAYYEHVVDMECARQEAVILGQSCPSAKIKEIYRSARTALEEVLDSLLTRPLPEEITAGIINKRINTKTGEQSFEFNKEREWLAEIYRSAALEVGFVEPIPEVLLKTPSSDIYSVTHYNSKSKLRALQMTAILLARLLPDHPLRSIAKRNPMFLCELVKATRLMGIASHANEEELNLEAGESIVDDVVYWLIKETMGLSTYSQNDR